MRGRLATFSPTRHLKSVVAGGLELTVVFLVWISLLEIPLLLGKAWVQNIAEFVRKLTNDIRVKEIIADPDPSNLRAIKAYEKAGFISVGVISTPNGQAMLMKFYLKRWK